MSSAAKPKSLAQKVLEIEDSLDPQGLGCRYAGEVILQAADWDELVRLASAVELVDAVEKAKASNG